MLAAALLTVMSFHGLFAGTVVGFVVSAALVASVRLPHAAAAGHRGGIYEKTTRGARIYLATPRLRGLLALNLAGAAAGAMVIVNTVVLVRAVLGRSDSDVAVALGCFGAGSMLSALLLPRILDRVPDRRVLLPAAAFLPVVLIALAAALGGGVQAWTWPALLAGWALIGLGYSAILTPAGRLLRRSAHAADRPALFAAQFALSHACWLVTYPLAGWLGAVTGMATACLVLAGLALAGLALAWHAWPQDDPEVLPHVHRDLPRGHAHLADAEPADGGFRHSHAFVIDREHPRWPRVPGAVTGRQRD
jgi:predicted MFS family arabinose efflux permease